MADVVVADIADAAVRLAHERAVEALPEGATGRVRAPQTGDLERGQEIHCRRKEARRIVRSR